MQTRPATQTHILTAAEFIAQGTTAAAILSIARWYRESDPATAAKIKDIAYDAVHGKPAERQTAIDDATCREKINYEEKTEQILDTYMTTFLEKEQDLIERVTTSQKTAEENARKILG